MKTPSQPRAIYYIVAIQIWEYFSFYGMRALLILYLTHQLGFDDSHAIRLFSAYASLVYVTPVLGGWLADRLLGNRFAVMAGALLMTLGHVVLGVASDSTLSLYLALAIIICGYGLFKSNISALLGELYGADDPRRDGGFSLLYAAGNVGSIAAPVACGLIAQAYGWHVGFALAGIGMFIGLLIFLRGQRHFRQARGVNKSALMKKRFALPTWSWLLVTLCLAPLFFTLVLKNDWSGYLLAVVCALAARMMVRIMMNAPEHRRMLWQIILLMLTGTLFWVLAQQGGSSISLFIDHFVDRHLLRFDVPTALFQSVNAFAVMAAGVALTWLALPQGSLRSVLQVWMKFVFGLALMGSGFMLLAVNARRGQIQGQASMGLMVAGLALMGCAELFIDPVAMAQITRIAIPGITGVLIGIYMLATGAVANWLAGVVAQQTTSAQISGPEVAAYHHFFTQMGEWTLGMIGVILAVMMVSALLSGYANRLSARR